MSNYKTLEELKKAFQEKNTKSDDGGDRNANAIWKKRYDFFKINAGETAVVRFLPDANVENPLVFVKEIFTHKLRVNGHSKTIPCLKRLYVHVVNFLQNIMQKVMINKVLITISNVLI